MGRAEKPSSVTRSEDERIENSPSEIRGRSLVRARSAKEITMKVIPSSIANPFIKAHHYSGKVVNNSKLHFGVFLDGQLHGVIRTLSPLRLGRSDGKRQAAERRGRAHWRRPHSGGLHSPGAPGLENLDHHRMGQKRHYAAVSRRVNKKGQPVKDLVRNEAEAAIKAELYHKVVDEGYGLHRLANWLNEQGIKTKRGTTLWRNTSVRAMIGNPIDRGQMHSGDVLSEPFEHLRIIDDYYFYKAVEIIRGRASTKREGPLRTDSGGVTYRHDLLRRMWRAPDHQPLPESNRYAGRPA